MQPPPLTFTRFNKTLSGPSPVCKRPTWLFTPSTSQRPLFGGCVALAIKNAKTAPGEPGAVSIFQPTWRRALRVGSVICLSLGLALAAHAQRQGGDSGSRQHRHRWLRHRGGKDVRKQRDLELRDARSDSELDVVEGIVIAEAIDAPAGELPDDFRPLIVIRRGLKLAVEERLLGIDRAGEEVRGAPEDS